MPPTLADARALLHRHFGYPDFRPAQRRVVESVLGGADTLAILPTGGGKSICFQVPALAMGGLTVVVSPLISLMQDQVDAALARGVSAAARNSGLGRDATAETMARVRDGTLRLLYVSPERLRSLAPILAEAGVRPSLLAIDEAHCIAEWGHDFRPSYRLLRGARTRLGWPPTVALTGSATPEVRRDIIDSLGLGSGPGARRRPCAVHLGSFDRSNLWFAAVRVAGRRERLAVLLDLLADADHLAIVYAPTRNVTEALARVLRDAGHRAAPYHAGLSRERRRAVLEEFLDDRLDVVVATCAFGMGIDKPNVRLVVHWAPPPTPESYYQEAGRAGRDSRFARCVLLWHEDDFELHRRQLDVTFPARKLVERLWSDPAAARGVAAGVLASADRLRHELRPDRGPVDWTPVERRRRAAESRVRAIRRYAAERRCRRAALLAYFGEALGSCAGCDRCGRRQRPRPLAPAIAARERALRQALAARPGPWGGCPLEPDTVARLAAYPPATGAALADVPGVGPAVAERFGGLILRALHGGALPATVPAEPASPLLAALVAWRSGAAAQLGVPPYTLLTDRGLAALADARPADRTTLARASGMGPRALARYEQELLRILAGAGTESGAVPAKTAS